MHPISNEHRAQGQRNKKVAYHLFDNTEYFDWVLTTAFYSALHIIKYHLFPFQDKNDLYSDWNEYYSKRNNGDQPHKVLKALCRRANSTKDIFSDYIILFNECDTAR